jgi:hypothetical protein
MGLEEVERLLALDELSGEEMPLDVLEGESAFNKAEEVSGADAGLVELEFGAEAGLSEEGEGGVGESVLEQVFVEHEVETVL